MTRTKLTVAGLLISVAAFLISQGSAVLFGLDSPNPSWLEVAAVTASYICTLLATHQFRAQYYWGLITTALYVWLFIRFDLPASATLNAILVVQLIYGFFRWGSDDDSIPVTRTKLKEWPGYILATGALYGIVTFVSMKVMDSSMPLLDSLILALSILAQWLLDNKKIETWFIWMVVNVTAIYVYFSADLWLTGWQYVFFLVNAFYGLYSWKRSLA